MYDEDTTLNSGAPGYVVVAETHCGTERHFYAPGGGWLHSINRGGARLFGDEEDAYEVARAVADKVTTRNIRVIPDAGL